MKLNSLNFRYSFDKIGPGPDHIPMYKIEGSATFKGEMGAMVFNLNQDDIDDIEALLRKKCKDLATEA